MIDKDELPGMLSLSIAIGKGEWPHTMDAQIWAKKWLEIAKDNQDIAQDEGTMISWFANAIMAGYDTAIQRCCKKVTMNETSDDSFLDRADYLLKRLEWSGTYSYCTGWPCCPICKGIKPGFGVDRHGDAPINTGHSAECPYNGLFEDENPG